ncbi:MAG: magnesium transporter [Halolamina sp.]
MTEWSVRAITRAMMPVLVVLTLVELGSGLVLGSFEADLLRFPSLLVLVPVSIGTAGNLGSVLASRLSTAVHLGTVSFAPTDEVLAGDALATVGLAVALFPLLGASAWALTAITGGSGLALATVVFIAGLAGLALSVLAVVVTVTATYAAYRLELDPDDVVIPVVTNTCDVLGVLVLFAVVQLVV